MDERVATNIKRSFERGSSSNWIADESELQLGTPYWQFPNFFRREGGELGSPQADHFGFYALAKAVHAILVGTMYLQAGDALGDADFFAPRVVCYYTASLNMTQAHLALCGRVFVDNPKGPLKPYPEHRPGQSMFDPLSSETGTILGVLATDSHWVFERRRQNHASRWGELERVYPNGRGLPDEFVDLFEYVLSYGSHEYAEVCEADDYDAALLSQGGRAAARTRHEAMYQGYGYDDFALDLMLNRESSGVGLERKAEAFQSFVISAGSRAMSDALEATALIDDSSWDGLQLPFGMAVMTPEFEIPAMDASSNDAYVQILSKLVEKVLPTRSRRPSGD